MKARFKIGQKFTRVRPTKRQAHEETITDILTTVNQKGEVIKIRYVATHLFCGQIVTDHDVIDTTIARGLTVKL